MRIKTKLITSTLIGALIGMAIMFIGMKMATPFEYNYNKEDKTITFKVDKEIVTDYETLERNFSDSKDYGTTFKVYFEEK